MKIIESKEYKITIEKTGDDRFIATRWDKCNGREFDRDVYVFETYGGACEMALELLAEANGLFIKNNYSKNGA